MPYERPRFDLDEKRVQEHPAAGDETAPQPEPRAQAPIEEAAHRGRHQAVLVMDKKMGNAQESMQGPAIGLPGRVLERKDPFAEREQPAECCQENQSDQKEACVE